MFNDVKINEQINWYQKGKLFQHAFPPVVKMLREKYLNDEFLSILEQ